MCQSDLDLLKQWQLEHNRPAGLVTQEGLNETKYLAIQYQRAFPDLFEEIYDQQKFLFAYTNIDRNVVAYEAFVDALFGENAHRFINVTKIPDQSTFLSPYHHCLPWLQYTSRKVKKEGSEYVKFQRSEIFNGMVKDVSTRLGLKTPLTHEQIEDIFDVCRHELAWNTTAYSPWCTAFTPNQTSVMEYLEDLEYYYGFGYAFAANSNMQCETMVDMVKYLESENLPKVVAYFVRSSTLRFMETSMGIDKEPEPLRADNYHAQLNRKWRSSTLFPYGGNLAAVKYNCSDESEREKVKFFLNEKPVEFNWCENGLCDLSEVQERYSRFISGNCSTMYCKDVYSRNTASSIRIPLSFTAASLILFYLTRRRT